MQNSILITHPKHSSFTILHSPFTIINSSLSIFIFFSLLGFLPLHGQKPAAPFAEAVLTSQHVVPGESCHLIVRMRGGDPDNRPVAPVVKDTAVNFVQAITQLDAQRKLITTFLFRITPVHAGPLTIPPIALRSRGETYHTPPLPLLVHPIEKLIALPSGIGKHKILVGWFPEKQTLYQGEQCPITLKLYIPNQLPVALNGWGLPDPAKDNCLAWRFSLPKTNDRNQVTIDGTIDGTTYQSSTFTTTLNGITPGPATFGPAPLRIIVRQSIIDPLRGSRLVNTPVHLTLPAISFNILDLPEGAPAHFHGAVGNFSIHANSSQTHLNANEPTEVILRIRGRGSLATLRAPELSGDRWKIIDSTKITRGEERKSIQGSVTFRQLLRPVTTATATDPLPTSIPAYILSYFNPADQSYHTISTPPLPIQITSSTDPSKPDIPTPEKQGAPPEEMRAILGFINRPITHTNNNLTLSPLWHIAPALVALLLIGLPIRKKIKAATTQHPDTIRQQKALNALAQEMDQHHFYRKAGHFIEQWLLRNGSSQSDEIQNILTERDATCFKADDTTTPPIDPKRKKAILSLLKRCSKLTLTILIVLIQISHITQANSTQANDPQSLARDAWKTGQYQHAIQLYQQAYPEPLNTPADILYNIGNCHHRLNQPGLAALAWRRALTVNPSHPQARQNLRFVELEQTAIVPRYETWQPPLTLVSPRIYQALFYTSLWLFALTILAIIILRPRGFKLTATIILIVITPVTATVGALAIHWYPDDHSFAPAEKQAIILKKTHFYHEAHRQETTPRTLPAASLIRIDAERGPWTHIISADGKNGWIQSNELQTIIP